MKELLINEDIRDKEVRVIAADGSQLGVMDTREAQRLSIEQNLDLVKIAPQATPPVCWMALWKSRLSSKDAIC